MHLGDRGGGHGSILEIGEQIGDGLAEFGLDQRSRLPAREGREAVLQTRQIGGDLVAEQIGPGR